jgi:predicted amidohydrolase
MPEDQSMRSVVLISLLAVVMTVRVGAQIKSTVRLGLFSAVPAYWDLQRNWQVFERTVEEHASEGVDLIITPECYLDGYAVNAKDWNPQRFATIAQNVESSPYIRHLRELAAEYKVYVLFGFTESSAGKFFDSAMMVNRTGGIVGIYHKTMLQKQDLRFSPGQELSVFDTEWGKMGILICADRRWPESARVERLKGARIVLIPSYGMWGLNNEWWMRTRSYENGNFLAFVHPSEAFVADPRGELIARLQTNVPAMLVSDVNLSKTSEADIRDRRPELYHEISRPKKSP